MAEVNDSLWFLFMLIFSGFCFSAAFALCLLTLVRESPKVNTVRRILLLGIVLTVPILAIICLLGAFDVSTPLSTVLGVAAIGFLSIAIAAIIKFKQLKKRFQMSELDFSWEVSLFGVFGSGYVLAGAMMAMVNNGQVF